MRLFKLFIILFCSSVYLFYSNAMANEEAKYEVIQKNEIYEVRKYSDRLAVKHLIVIKIQVLENYLIIFLVIIKLIKKLV